MKKFELPKINLPKLNISKPTGMHRNKKVILSISCVAVAAIIVVIVIVTSRATGENAEVMAASLDEKSLQTASLEAAHYEAESKEVLSVRSLSEVLPDGGVIAMALQQSTDDITAQEIAAAAEAEAESMKDSYGFSYEHFAMAQVDSYVNVRSEPTADSAILGKMYDGSIAEILGEAGENNEWYNISSGSVEGYIKKEYFITGAEAASAADKYLKQYAYVIADALNVRKDASIQAERIGSASRNDVLEVINDQGEWIEVQYTESKKGFVSKEYVELSIEYSYAISLEEEAAKKAEELARIASAQQKAAQENTNVSSAGQNSYTLPDVTYTTNEELRQSIVDYAMQYLGNKYVHAGGSLESGTDCSGFTCYIYAAFGYSISRTPIGQFNSAGTSISVSEMQPGDIICYGTSTSNVTHVAMYIGNGQIIHSANPRKGVVTQNYDYGSIVGIKSIVG